MSNEYEVTIRELQISIMRYQELEAELKSQIEIFSKKAFYTKAKSKLLIKRVDELIQAIENEGRIPRYHRYTLKKHRKEWPTLWKAIDRLIEDRKLIER